MTGARRLLPPDDAPVFRALRLEMLSEFPDAYASAYDDLVDLPLDAWVRRLGETPVWAVFENDAAVGMMGYLRERPSKMAHRASLIMVYVRDAARGRGVADSLLGAVLEGARREGLAQLELAVLATNRRAIGFYSRHGFRICGTIPGGIRLRGVDHDEHLMVRPVGEG